MTQGFTGRRCSARSSSACCCLEPVDLEAECLTADEQPLAILLLPDLEVLDFGRHNLAAVHCLCREMIAHQGGIAGKNDFLIEHLQFVKGALAGLDVCDERFLVLNGAAGVSIREVVGGQRIELLYVLVPHGLRELVYRLGNISLVRSRRSGVAGAKEQK